MDRIPFHFTELYLTLRTLGAMLGAGLCYLACIAFGIMIAMSIF